MADLTVMEAKRYGVYTCGPSVPLLNAARRMADEDISALVVVDDDGYLAGIITRTDLLRARYERADWESQSVAGYMSSDVVTVGLQARLSEVMALLLDNQIHRVVAVRNEGGKLRPVAVVSAADLIYHMVKNVEV